MCELCCMLYNCKYLDSMVTLTQILMVYRIYVSKLIPSVPCEDYVYRFKHMGEYEKDFDSFEQACDWWTLKIARSIDVDDSMFSYDIRSRGWSGWYPGSLIGFNVMSIDPISHRLAAQTTKKLSFSQMLSMLTCR